MWFLRIYINDPGLDIDLSEQHLVSCVIGAGCSGGSSSKALLWANTVGIVDEACFPYVASDDSCDNKCVDWEDRTSRVLTYYIVSTSEEIKEEIDTYGPVTGQMYAWIDFNSYSDGIYEHVSGSTGGWHVISIVGYNDPGDYDADGVADEGIFRPGTGKWWIPVYAGGNRVDMYWGRAADVPVPADYDGDGAADRTVFNPSSSQWAIYQVTTISFGTTGDSAVSGTAY